ncbi:MAG: P-II family nitrogen regulator [Hyphomicrobiales bacterium]|jgi:nitrogen regulatory protein P-II 2|nr:P-II family nitrogen regulator [Hyphomicrobiales bacterium]
MKLITAIIKPFKLDDVRKSLVDLGIEGMTVTEAKGFGRQKGHTEVYRGAEYEVNFIPKIQIDIVIKDEILDSATSAIVEAAKTDKVGDGKIFVFDVNSAIRIRTGEVDAEAL